MERTPVLIRVPATLQQKLRDAANTEHRSLNAQITVILEEWVKAHNGKKPAGVTRS